MHTPFSIERGYTMNNRLSTAQIFTDNMVLQREKNVRVWGEGRENATVTVTINISSSWVI